MNPAKADPRWTEGDSQAPGPNPRQRFRLEPKSQPPRRQYIYQSCLDHLLSLLIFTLRNRIRSVNGIMARKDFLLTYFLTIFPQQAEYGDLVYKVWQLLYEEVKSAKARR